MHIVFAKPLRDMRWAHREFFLMPVYASKTAVPPAVPAIIAEGACCAAT